MRILIVEDDRDTAETTGMLLQVSGHEVSIASDGPTALRLANPFDLVILDLGLPGLSGFEVARRLKQIKPPTIVAVTGFSDPQARLRSIEAGIDLHLVKPVAPQDLLQMLGQMSA
jgi:DNA-binding response OmpR family regulator